MAVASQLERQIRMNIWKKVLAVSCLCAAASSPFAAYADASKSVQVVYDRNTKRFFARNAEGKEISRFRDSCDLVEVEGEITIEYFLDHSMIEVYLNQKKAMTLRNYVADGERKISVSSSSTNARVSSIQLWNMKSAYDEKESRYDI